MIIVLELLALPLLLIAVALDSRTCTRRLQVLAHTGQLTADQIEVLSGRRLRRGLLIALGVALALLVAIVVTTSLMHR